TEFILQGLTQDRTVAKVCCLLFSLFYTTTILGNLLIIVTVRTSDQLNSPMYFFLSSLSLIDISYATVSAPKLIHDLLVEEKTISFTGCMAQVFGTHFFGCTEVFLLMAMAYDRCVAICSPLHYPSVVSPRLCRCLVASSVLGGLVHSLLQTLLVLQLPFCGPKNGLDHYFCDVHPLLALACADTRAVTVTVAISSGVVVLGCFTVLAVSYGVILAALRTRSAQGQLKALSTCSSHILAVLLFFGPCVFVHLRPSVTLPADKVVSVFYTIIAPMLNPFIYTLRNRDVKSGVSRLWSRALQR
ncbi:OR4S2 protein, partial [Campylorhamphus procurvoides]|nr:OR4S2 protein [Campylorhamphus procurvoides]